MKVYEALAKAFAAEGTTAIFGLMGDANQYWIDSLDQLGVTVYEVRHEGAGFSMADGWARINGAPGVCTTTSGPGTSQIATAAIVAARAHTPLVAFCGDTNVGDKASSQHMDHERFAAACEAGFVRVYSAEHAYEGVKEAFYRARLESRPIILSVPMDIQQQAFDDTEEYVPSRALFTARPAYPNPSAIDEAVDIIARSEKVVVIAGRGARAAGAGDAIVRLANRTGALLSTSLLALNWLSDTDDYHAGVSGLYATHNAIELFQEANCVIAIGASLNQYTTEHGYLYPDATFIHLDAKPQVVMGDGRSADCYIQTDARLGVEVLDRALEERSIHKIGYRTPEVKERLTTSHDDLKQYELEPGTIDPREACRVVDDAIPKEIGLVLSGGHQVGFGVLLCTRPRSMTLANSHHFGCIGQGLVVSIGAIVANGMKPAFMLDGDAGFMMHLAEFETAVRYEIPLLAVILNDEQLGAEYHKAMAKGLNPSLAKIRTPDLGAVGVALGGRGRLVRTVDELRSAAAEFVADPTGPMIIDVRISPNVQTIPYRRIWFGQES